METIDLDISVESQSKMIKEKKEEKMKLCKTDIKTIICLLESGADLIDGYCEKAWQQDKTRLMRNMSKKLRRKFDKQLNQDNTQVAGDSAT